MSGTRWYLLRQEKLPAAYNMALDEALLESASQREGPVLRFYGWTEAAATFGYSQPYAEVEKWTLLRPLIRRPTGGGLVPHDADWTYSVIVPPGHEWYELKAMESYRRVHEWIRDAFAKLEISTTLAPEAVKDIPGQCFVGAEKSDVLWHGRKVAGAAQRRTHAGLLIQGSVQPPPVRVARADWETAMCEVARQQWQADWETGGLIGSVAARAAFLEESKFSQARHNQKR